MGQQVTLPHAWVPLTHPQWGVLCWDPEPMVGAHGPGELGSSPMPHPSIVF